MSSPNPKSSVDHQRDNPPKPVWLCCGSRPRLPCRCKCPTHETNHLNESNYPPPPIQPPQQPQCNSTTPHAEDQDHPAAPWICVLWHFFASHSCCSTWQNLSLNEYPICSKQMVAGMKTWPLRNSSAGMEEFTPFIFYPVTPSSTWRFLP